MYILYKAERAHTYVKRTAYIRRRGYIYKTKRIHIYSTVYILYQAESACIQGGRSVWEDYIRIRDYSIYSVKRVYRYSR